MNLVRSLLRVTGCISLASRVQPLVSVFSILRTVHADVWWLRVPIAVPSLAHPRQAIYAVPKVRTTSASLLLRNCQNGGRVERNAREQLDLAFVVEL